MALSHLPRTAHLVTMGLAMSLLAACMPIKPVRVAAVALTADDVARAAAKQKDIELVRAGSPAYLMLLDALIEAYPTHSDLLVGACRAYSSYASTLSDDGQRDRALLLYEKAKSYGFRALSRRVDFQKAASGELGEFKAVLQQLGKEDMPALFWTAGAWASWIQADLNSMEALADIPALEAALRRILELDERYFFGGPHIFMGTYLAAKPAILGGDLGRAKEHFERGFALGSDKILMAKVLFAQHYAVNMRDRPLFVSTLQQVIAARADEVPDLTLANTVAQATARKLLDKTEDYFANQP